MHPRDEGKVIDRLAGLIKRQPMNGELNQQLELVYPVRCNTARDVHLINTTQVQIAMKPSGVISRDSAGRISNSIALSNIMKIIT
jgi:hypothetical protein